jgi:hypothetical protein
MRDTYGMNPTKAAYYRSLFADLILVGALYKLACAATAFYYWWAGTLPHVAFAALFGVADAVFFVLMAECYWSVRKKAAS